MGMGDVWAAALIWVSTIEARFGHFDAESVRPAQWGSIQRKTGCHLYTLMNTAKIAIRSRSPAPDRP
jgi:hypothetical protein